MKPLCSAPLLLKTLASGESEHHAGSITELSLCNCSLRAAAITTSWAFTTALISSVSYISTRTSGAINDTQQEHSIVAILTVSIMVPPCVYGDFQLHISGFSRSNFVPV